MKISELKPLQKNPFKSTGDEQIKRIAKSIHEFERMMEIRRIVIDEDNNILGGNKRYFALKKLGYKEIPDAWIEKVEGLSEEQKKEFIVKDNAHFGSEWDYELLGEWNVDLEAWGVGDVEFADADEKEVKEDDYEIPDEIETDIVLGDLIEIGEHRLLCGDSTDSDSVAKLMNGEKADMVFTDPPYNVNYGNKADAINKYGYAFSDRRIMNDYMPSVQFIAFLDNAFRNMKTALRPGGAFYIWHASITVYEFEQALRLNELKTSQQLIWVKNSMVMGRQDYQWKHEPCLYGWKEGAGHYFTPDRTNTTVIDDKIELKKLSKADMLKMLQEIYSDKTKTTVLYCDKPYRSAEHPTMKPILLIAPLIENSSKKGWIVLDPFLGSGSTMVAAHQLKRKCYGMELDSKYCQVIVDRMRNLDPDIVIKKNGMKI